MPGTFVLPTECLFAWTDKLVGAYDLYGPVAAKKNQTIFRKIEKAEDLKLDYDSTMTSPRSLIYPARQDLCTIDRKTHQHKTVTQVRAKKRIIFAIHPCDMHAISILDRTFLGDFKDFYYGELRRETLTVVLNCSKACAQGFCASMGTGPFLQLEQGFDLVLTAKSKNYLVECGSERGKRLVEKASGLRKARRNDLAEKEDIESRAKKTFAKGLETIGLPDLLMRNLDHPVYERTADRRCLGCTNCTMVCPTCYCYNVEDHTELELRTTTRERHWDSCQELNFARVHEGNFRSSRRARLRQFVTHKLATWLEQYGCFGCVGCGRCMTWCPTGIDLTEIAKEIQRDYEAGRAK